MKISRNKILSAIAVILLVSTYAMIAASERPVLAATFQTHVYVQFSPNPVGVGQQVGIVMWSDEPVETAQVGNSDRYHNYTVQIFGPDGKMIPGVDIYAQQNNGTTDIPLVYDTTSSSFQFFTPTVVGHYTFFAFHNSETIGANTYYGNNVTGSFDVQQDAIPTPFDSFPLPQEYWGRPIENQNVYWYTLSSNWLNSVKDRNYEGIVNDRFQQDGIAPNSAHVMWTQPVTDALTAYRFGGQFPGSSFYNSPPFSNVIIMNGNLYYAVPSATGALSGEYKVVDLRTGQIKNDYFGVATPQFGNYYDADNYNQHGVSPADGTFFYDNGTQAANPLGLKLANDITYNNGSLYVGFKNGTQWLGQRVGNPDGVGDAAFAQFSVLNDVPTWGAPAQGISGEVLYGFVFNNGATTLNPTGNDWQVRLWNTTLSGVTETGTGSNASGTTQTSRLTNISASTGGPAMPVTLGGQQVVLQPDTVAVSLQLTEENYTYRPFSNFYLLCENGTLPTAIDNGTKQYTYFAIALANETLNGVRYLPGNITFITTFTAAQGQTILMGPSADGVFTTVVKETGVITAYSMITGAKLWSTPNLTSATAYPYTPSTTATGSTASIAYNTLYTAGSSGQVYAWDLNTGALKWGYSLPMTGVSGVSAYPTHIGVIADDKIYLGTYTLTSSSSLYSNAVVTCLNAWTGAVIWTLPAWGGAGGFAVSDGYMTMLNYYDLNVYCIGKGPSAITVNSEIGNMNKATITGTILDASPGSAIKGTGCIADSDMSNWMAYMFQNAAKPNATGVDVTISVVDPNGNSVVVGTTAAKADGTFSLEFVPQVSGEYHVIATFAGTNSYYPSFAHSTMFVNEVAPPTASPTPTAVVMTQTYVLGSTAAIIIALAIAAVVLALVLRKRP